MNGGVFGFPGNNGLGTIAETAAYNSGSGTWTKPAGYDDRDTVLIRMWGGGGSGAAINGSGGNASGGGGGAFAEISLLYADCPATLGYFVGAGGAAVGSSSNGNAGGTSYVVDGFIKYIEALGGAGGTQAITTGQTGGAGGAAKFFTQSTCPTHWTGATGGAAGSGVSTAGGFTAHGSGGGGAASLPDSAVTGGGISFIGGAGGAGSNNTATAGAAPGGGGGGAANTVPCTSGAGGSGRIEFIIIRGRHITPLSWFV